MTMKKFIIVMIVACTFAGTAFSQTKAIGVRGGFGAEASYQHWMGWPQFMEVDLGLDLVGGQGFKLTGTYNWIIAEPAITYNGTWDVYMGPGVSLGYVYDTKSSDCLASAMAAFVVQFGLEYLPWRHFCISADVRPMIGYHFGTKDIYRGGLMGFIPSLALRYEF